MKFKNEIRNLTRTFLQKLRLRALALNDIHRFSRSATFSLLDNSYDQLCARIMYNVHGLEKGFTHKNNFRPKFGLKNLRNLNDTLLEFEKHNYSKDSFAFQEGIAILNKYNTIHKEKGVDTAFLSSAINVKFLKSGSDSKHDAGVKSMQKRQKENSKQKNFKDLALGRSSIRTFSGNSVDISRVYNALNIARKTPSVCNRQGWKVILVKDKGTIKELLKIQHGFGGYPYLPEYVITIVGSETSYLSPVERNEVYIDGGLFAMSVIYALEYESLAAVPLNAMMNSKEDANIRKLLHLKNSEVLILFIGVGDLPDETVVPISSRLNVAEFTREI